MPRDWMSDPNDRHLMVQDENGHWIQVPLDGQETGALRIGDLWKHGFARRPMPDRAEDERRLIEVELGRRDLTSRKKREEEKNLWLERYLDYIQKYLEAMRKRANGEDVPLPTLVIETPEEKKWSHNQNHKLCVRLLIQIRRP